MVIKALVVSVVSHIGQKKWKNLKKKDFTGPLRIEFPKPFECLPQNHLIAKPHTYELGQNS